MVELVDKFLQYCDVYYVDRAGKPTSTIHEMTRVTGTLTELYGDVPVKDFGPLALRAVRQVWIKEDLTITTINSYTGKVRAMFKWGSPTSWWTMTCTRPFVRSQGYVVDGEWGEIHKSGKPFRWNRWRVRSAICLLH